MNTLYSKTLVRISEGSIGFGIKDQKGREVGYKWTVSHATYTEKPADAMSGYIRPNKPLSCIEVWATPTRDGEGYGPAFNTNEVATEAEAAKVVAKRTEAARKSAAKKFS